MYLAQCQACHTLWASDPDAVPTKMRCANRIPSQAQNSWMQPQCWEVHGDKAILWPLHEVLQGPLLAAYQLDGWVAVQAIIRVDSSDVIVGLKETVIDLPYPWRCAQAQGDALGSDQGIQPPTEDSHERDQDSPDLGHLVDRHQGHP